MSKDIVILTKRTLSSVKISIQDMGTKVLIWLKVDFSGQEHPILNGFQGLIIGQKEIILNIKPKEISITKCMEKGGTLMS